MIVVFELVPDVIKILFELVPDTVIEPDVTEGVPNIGAIELVCTD